MYWKVTSYALGTGVTVGDVVRDFFKPQCRIDDQQSEEKDANEIFGLCIRPAPQNLCRQIIC